MASLVFAAPAFAAVPSLGDLDGDRVAWAGAGLRVTLDAGSNATPGDADLEARNGGVGDWSGAALTVQRAGGAVNADVFGFETTGAAFAALGSNLQSGGFTFASFSAAGGTLTITFTSLDSPATTMLVTDVLRRITYRNDVPGGDATVRFALSDGMVVTNADVAVVGDPIFDSGFE